MKLKLDLNENLWADKFLFKEKSLFEMGTEIFDNKLQMARVTEKEKQLVEKMEKSLVLQTYPEQLVNYLKNTIGDVVFIDSPRIELEGPMQFSVDMLPPVRQTTMLHALRDVCCAMLEYYAKNKGPIPPTWTKCGGEVMVPVDEVLHYRVKTNGIYLEPTKEQIENTKGWDIDNYTEKKPAPNSVSEVSFSNAVPFFDDPYCCFVAFGGRIGSNHIYLAKAIEQINRKISACGFKRIDSPEKFLEGLCVRFPNYFGVLLDMGWDIKDIPVSPDKLPEKLKAEYDKVDVMTHQYLRERLYKSAKSSDDAKEIATILRTMDLDVLGKKQEAREKVKRKAVEGEESSWDDEQPNWSK